jgi:hypothetical protein
MRRPGVTSGAEYALYWLAVNKPAVFEEAERFVGGMLAEDQYAIRRVKAVLAADSAFGAVAKAKEETG